jgi:hypothetical protein
MTAGLEIYAPDNSLLASSDLLTHFCRKTGTGTSVANTAGGAAASMVSVPIGALGYAKPLVAVSCASTLAFAGTSSGNFIYWCSGPVGTAFTYYVFDTADQLATAHVGLETYAADGSGKITFSAAHHPLLVLGVNAGTVTYTGKTMAAGLWTYGGFEIIGGLECWDGGSAFPWTDPETSGPCNDLRYRRRVNVRGAAIDTGGTRVATGSLLYEDVRVNAGTSSSYTQPPTALDTQGMIAAVDVTGIAVPATYF